MSKTSVTNLFASSSGRDRSWGLGQDTNINMDRPNSGGAQTPGQSSLRRSDC